MHHGKALILGRSFLSAEPLRHHNSDKSLRPQSVAAGLAATHLRLLVFALTVIGALAAAGFVAVKTGDGFAWDARAYYLADYTIGATTDEFAYLYPPAFAQAISPLRALPWEAFLVVWTSLQAVALVAMAGPLTLPLLFALPVAYELDVAGVTLLMALAIVVGFRYPGAWALLFLTKVTPGVGVLWFAFRREWRSFGIALGFTAGIVAVSFALAPSEWFAWVALMTSHAPTPGVGFLWVRLPLAVALLWWGARTDRRWVVPVAAMLALPVLRTTGLVLLVACIPLLRPAITRAVQIAFEVDQRRGGIGSPAR